MTKKKLRLIATAASAGLAIRRHQHGHEEQRGEPHADPQPYADAFASAGDFTLVVATKDAHAAGGNGLLPA